jgi:hypothetical protein
MISQIRTRVEKESTAMDLDQPIIVYRDKAESDWNIRTYDQLAKKLQRECSQSSTTLREVLGSDALYELTHLSMEMVCFPQLASSTKSTPTQMDLIAA